MKYFMNVVKNHTPIMGKLGNKNNHGIAIKLRSRYWQLVRLRNERGLLEDHAQGAIAVGAVVRDAVLRGRPSSELMEEPCAAYTGPCIDCRNCGYLA